jgi:hypothetical protein
MCPSESRGQSGPAAAQPSGTGDYVVQDGDCMSSIAEAHGFFWQTLWDHPQNASLKSARGNPNVLLPGDRVFIPSRTSKSVDCATEEKHRFVRKGTPSRIRLRLMSGDQPRAHLPYVIEVDGRTFQGETDDDGVLTLTVPSRATSARLTLRDGGECEEHIVQLGRLDPVEDIRGMQQRLLNLDYPCEVTGELDEQTCLALRMFQSRYGIPDGGEADQSTLDKLKEIHGS